MNTLIRTLHFSAPNKYVSEDGWFMCREYGKTPNRNPVAGRWVLRNECDKWVDFDKYRSDLAERNRLCFAFECPSCDHPGAKNLIISVGHGSRDKFESYYG